MSTETYKPAGYCPKCGYAMDVGQCPECGAEVTARTLARWPRGYWRRRVIRWGVILVLLVGVSYGGYRLWRSGKWVRWLPNDVLLWGMTWESDRIDKELLRRCENQTLSEDEMRRVFEFAYERRLVFPREIPAWTSVPAMVEIRWRGVLRHDVYWGDFGDTARDAWRIQVGEHTFNVPGSWLGHNCYEFGYEVWFDLPPLPPGQEIITVDGEFWEEEPPVKGLPAGTRLPVHLAEPLRVADRRMDEYVTDVWEPELAEKAGAGVLAGAVRWEECACSELALAFTPLPFSRAFDVYIRTDGQEEYEALEDAFGLPERVAVERGCYGRICVLLPWKGPVADAKTVDVQLRPSRAVALFYGYDACFGGVIEWLDLPLRDEPSVVNVSISTWVSVYDTSYCEVEEVDPPTRVFRWEGDE
ncbi:MAG: hypothetical protein PVJ57_10775 [Phycisphaerae bacterium]|jgi:hypothetical protein